MWFLGGWLLSCALFVLVLVLNSVCTLALKQKKNRMVMIVFNDIIIVCIISAVLVIGFEMLSRYVQKKKRDEEK